MAGEHTGASGSGAASSGPRAVEAASAAATPFAPRTSAMALRTGDRHMERFAPEHDAAARSRSLRALAFSDRVLEPHMTTAQRWAFRLFGPEQEPGGEREHDVESINWIFPRPWYLDEMSWLGAARIAAAQSAVRPMVSGGGPGARGTIPTELVAPSFSSRAAASRAQGPGAAGLSAMPFVAALPTGSAAAARVTSATPEQPGSRSSSAGQPVGRIATVAGVAARSPRSAGVLRAWSPLAPFAAAQAAELMAGVMQGPPEARRGSAADDASGGTLEPLAMLELVAPAELASRAVTPATAHTAPLRDQGASPRATVSEALRNRLERVLRQVESSRAARTDVRTDARAAGQTDAQVATAHSAPRHQDALPAQPVGAQGASAGTAAQGAAQPGERASSSAGLVSARERAADLLAKALVSGQASLAPIAGARVVLPAGMGGLLAGMRAADTVHKPIGHVPVRPAMLPVRSVSAGAYAAPANAAMQQADAANTRFQAPGGSLIQASSAPTPALAGEAADASIAVSRRPGSAYRAVTASRPSALGHIAWADRWLARFAGASPESLATLDATTGSAGARHSSRLLSAMAPLPIFLESPAEGFSNTGRGETGPTRSPAPAVSAAIPPAPRMNDDDVVPDEIFAAIAAAPLRRPGAASRGASSVAGKPDTTAPAESESTGERRARAGRPVIERLVRQDPGVPGPGVRVALASSPVAPALSPVLPLPSAQRFDVRAVSGGDLARVYLAGLMGPLPAIPAERPDAPFSLSPALAARAPMAELVSPSAVAVPGASPSSSPDAFFPDAAGRAPVTRGYVQAHGNAGVGAEAGAGSDAGLGAAVGADAADRPRTRAGSSTPAVDRGTMAVSLAAGAAPGIGAMTGGAAAYSNAYSSEPGNLAVRAESWAIEHERSTADLAFDFVSPELILAAQSYGFGPSEAAQATRLAVAGQSGLVTLASAMDLAFLEVFTGQTVSVDSGHSSAGASPIRGAGTGAGQATSAAADLHINDNRPAGGQEPGTQRPVHGTAGAAMGVGPGAAPGTGSSTGTAVTSGNVVLPLEPARPNRNGAFGMQVRAPRGAFLWPRATALAMSLQPSGTGDAAHASSLAALDLLAAHAVAEIATFVAPANAQANTHVNAQASAVGPSHRQGHHAAGGDGGPAGASATAHPAPAEHRRQPRPALEYTPLAPDSITAYLPRTSLLAASAPLATYVTPIIEEAYQDLGADGGDGGAGTATHQASGLPAMTAMMGHTPTASGSVAGRVLGSQGRIASSSDGSAERREAATAFSSVAATLSPELEAIYVALSQSATGRSMSPAVRAARALAMAEAAGVRGGSARARAAAAWAMMPMVLVEGGGDPGTIAGGAVGTEAAVPGWPTLPVPSMPGDRQEHTGLRDVASRAGESLQALIAPYSAQPALAGDAGSTGTTMRSGAAASSHQAQRGAVLRAPTAAQPLVQTGTSQPRSSSAAAKEMIRAAQMKRATGSPDIPPWFEEAARRMFEGNAGDGISLAEMTLVTAAPARHVAASPKTASASSQPPEAQGGSETGANEPTADVEQLAREVYAEICRLIEVARERNGDTWR